MWAGERNCDGCRYWSDMIARAGGGTTNPRGDTEALCLAKSGHYAGRYTTAEMACDAFARDTAGKVDGPPNYGEEACEVYAAEARARYPNGTPSRKRASAVRSGKGADPMTPKHGYTPEELDQGALRDLICDAEQSERQAIEGPFFPEKGITRESLLAYAAKCRASVERYRNGGAHRAVLKGEV